MKWELIYLPSFTDSSFCIMFLYSVLKLVPGFRACFKFHKTLFSNISNETIVIILFPLLPVFLSKFPLTTTSILSFSHGFNQFVQYALISRSFFSFKIGESPNSSEELKLRLLSRLVIKRCYKKTFFSLFF